MGDLIKDTQLIHVDIISRYETPSQDTVAFQKAVEANKRRFAITPYLAMNLFRMSDEHKRNYMNLSAQQHGTVEYAGGITAQLPEDLVNHIISFLPLMQGQVEKYRNKLNQHHQYEEGEKVKYHILDNM